MDITRVIFDFHQQVSKDGIPFTYHEFEVVLLSDNKQQFSQHFVSVILSAIRNRALIQRLLNCSKEVTWQHLRSHGQHPKEATKVSILDFLLILLPLWQLLQTFSKSEDEKAFPTLKELLTRLPEGCPLNLEVERSITILERKNCETNNFPVEIWSDHAGWQREDEGGQDLIIIEVEIEIYEINVRADSWSQILLWTLSLRWWKPTQ